MLLETLHAREAVRRDVIGVRVDALDLPPSTVTRSPQSASQMRQNVVTVSAMRPA
jgi:hypothetical protein